MGQRLIKFLYQLTLLLSKRMNSKNKSLVLLALPIALSLILSYTLQFFILNNQEQVNVWLSQFGLWIILIYILIQPLTIIIAPLGGFFMTIAMITLFGAETALILAYLIWTPCYLINFYLARKYGRPLVIKIVGKKPLEKVDHFVKDEGLLTLVLTRIFQGGNFDYLSYGWGLTKISFKTFTLVNFIAGIPAILITYFVLTRFENLVYAVGAFYLMTAFLSGLYIYIHYKYLSKRRFKN
jgi:uncharacterized membrane protein YdjX (TVP38/TMEM64 family)